jgi:hypothetical protein
MQIFLLFVIVLVGFIYCSFCDIGAFCQCHYGLVSKVIQLSEKKKKKKKKELVERYHRAILYWGKTIWIAGHLDMVLSYILPLEGKDRLSL